MPRCLEVRSTIEESPGIATVIVTQTWNLVDPALISDARIILKQSGRFPHHAHQFTVPVKLLYLKNEPIHRSTTNVLELFGERWQNYVVGVDDQNPGLA